MGPKGWSTFAKPRWEFPALGSLLEHRVVGMKLKGSGQQIRLGFHSTGIGQAALHWAHCLACLLIVEPHALGAEFGIDDVRVIPLGNGLVGAFGLAGAAADAVVGDMDGHGRSSEGDPLGSLFSGRFRGRGHACQLGDAPGGHRPAAMIPFRLAVGSADEWPDMTLGSRNLRARVRGP